MSRSSRPVAGFSLLEMMAVIVIIGLVMGVLVVNVMDRLQWARIETTKFKLKSLEHALDIYQIEARSYPTNEVGRAALLPGEGGGEGPDADITNWDRTRPAD